MYHSIEIEVDVLCNPEDESCTPIPLEVQFDFNPKTNNSKITGYYMDDVKVDIRDFYDYNPSLESHIDRAIEHYLLNYEV